MENRWFSAAVVLLWVATMSWLVKEKVLPPLLVGEPPHYGSILEAKRTEPPVGWTMSWNGRPIGWAINTALRDASGTAEIRSRVHFDEMPLEDLVPSWVSRMIWSTDRPEVKPPMDCQSRLLIDPLGQIAIFESAIRVAPLPDAIKLTGTVRGRQLKVAMRAGDAAYETELRIDPAAMLEDALAPQTQLPGLRRGQTWTVEVCSPLQSPSNPVEILHASVEERETIRWERQRVDTWVVVYRSDPGFGGDGARRPRGRMWVRPDGTVLKQQVRFFNSTMLFTRMADAEAAILLKNVEGLREFETVGGDSSRRLHRDQKDRRLETPPTEGLWHLNSPTPSKNVRYEE